LLKYSMKLGISEAEVFIRRNRELNLDGYEKLESVTYGDEVGIGVRFILGKKVGFFSSTISSENKLEDIVKSAYKVAKISREDPNWKSLTKEFGKSNVKGIYDRGIESFDPEKLLEWYDESLQVVRSSKEDVKITNFSSSMLYVETYITSTMGLSLFKKESFTDLDVNVTVSVNGEKACGEDYWLSRMVDVPVEKVSRNALRNALDSARGKMIKTCKMPVIMENNFFSKILSLMFSATLSADSIQKGSSPYKDLLGSAVFSENFTLIDDGLLPYGIGTSPFDDEGVPQRKVSLFERGVLKGFLYDTYTAYKEGKESTGNAQRSYDSIPRPAPNNFYVKPGDVGFDEIIEETKRGILVRDSIGEWFSNPISGEINATVTLGFMVEDGEIKYPVSGVIISGNLFDVLKNKLEFVGKDLCEGRNTICPTIKLSEMTIAGK
ncbi:MAG: TldD/PmbA family protein, partial [Candidatus Odinarchaeota archaeon]|nr:TldD/PmbA family protein [Candidatus Odinarchaeota archaeon]